MVISSITSFPRHRRPELRPLSSVAADTSSSSAAGMDERIHHQEEVDDHVLYRNLPLEEDEDDEDDPSRWEPIHNTASSSTTTTNNHPRQSIKVHVPPLLCDCVSFFWEWTFAAVDVWVEVLSAPPFPLETLRKVSIIMLGMERIRDNLEKSTVIVLDATNSNGLPWAIPQYVMWGIPGFLALLSLSFVLTVQLSWGQQEEAVIATALILLIFLEALLPLFILGCTSMFLFQQLSWETGLILLVVVWLGSTFCAHCIRRMLYQSLGHG